MALFFDFTEAGIQLPCRGYVSCLLLSCTHQLFIDIGTVVYKDKYEKSSFKNKLIMIFLIRRLRKIPDIDAKYPKQRYAEENMKQCISNLLAWVKG